MCSVEPDGKSLRQLLSYIMHAENKCETKGHHNPASQFGVRREKKERGRDQDLF